MLHLALGLIREMTQCDTYEWDKHCCSVWFDEPAPSRSTVHLDVLATTACVDEGPRRPHLDRLT